MPPFSIRDPRSGATYTPKGNSPVVSVPAISAHGPSTCLSKITYNTQSNQLLLTFRKGGQYSYSVPPSTASGLMNASSKGRFFNKAIKPRFG